MNVIRLMGGIGNQMFQYAFGKVFQELGKEVAYDISWFSIKQTYPRPYRLDKFQADLKFSNFTNGNPIIMGGDEKYNPSIFNLDNHNFEGYWQHLRYYTSIRAILQQKFTLKPETYTEKYKQLAHTILNSESVAIHVRRGDYLKLWPIMGVKYYANAISRIQGDLFIFSDGIHWCREAFREENLHRKITFVDLQDYLAFELMRFCKHKILGNSTFSWWAAFLEDSGTVICPKGWLGFKNTFEEDKRYPEKWIKLENE